LRGPFLGCTFGDQGGGILNRPSRWISRAAIIVVAFACSKDSSGPVGGGTGSSGTLVLSSAETFFDAMASGANPGTAAINVTNGSTGTLSGLRTVVAYTPGQPTGWLSASLSSSSAPSTLTLAAMVAGLAPGTYSATVAVTGDGATNGPQTIAVTLMVLASGIYVSTTDVTAVDDATCGLGPVGVGGRHPCRTITQGMARAVAIARSAVLVADGVYDESVTLANGISLLGGHQPDTWVRHLATTNTVIQGSAALGVHRFAVRATAISAATVFEGFVVKGPFVTTASANSYAIYVANANANLLIRNNVIVGGRGGPGGAGSTGGNGTPATAGGGRASNPSGYDAFITMGTGSCNVSNNRTLTNGGAATFGGDVGDGGRGGGNTCPPSSTLVQQSAGNGVVGQAGAPTGGGAGGTPGTGGADFRLESNGTLCQVSLSLATDGGNGGPGNSGANGAAVSGGASATGAVVAGHWAGSSGSTGQNGANGGGGGGGGAGAGAYCTSCTENHDRLGGLGGGGGSGGAGGSGGGSGSAGGGTFGVFVTGGAAAPVVSNNVVVRGEGGVGGNGGNAGAGSVGGAGGDGGAGIFCTGSGGKGGKGGDGGHGSGGGGGSGGVSYGFYTSGVGTPNYCQAAANNVVSGGLGGPNGSGGGSLINPGGSGQVGALADCSFN
jgi:hypothetical protein